MAREGAVRVTEQASAPVTGRPGAVPASSLEEGTALDYVVEPLQAVAGGAATMAGAGLSGLAQLAATQDPMQAADVVRETQESSPDFAPETEAGVRGLETLGDLVELGIDIVNFPISGLAGLTELAAGGDLEQAAATVRNIQQQGLGETLGERTFEETGSPLAATAAQMAPEIAESLVGGGAARQGVRQAQRAAEGARRVARQIPELIPRRAPATLVDADGFPKGAFNRELKNLGLGYSEVVDEIPRLPEGIKPKDAAQEIVKRKIRAGDTEGGLATRRIDDTGSVVVDDLAESAIKEGFDPADIQATKQVSNPTRKRMLEMLRNRARIQNNRKLAQTIDPYNTVGDSAMERVMFIRDTVTDARKQLDEIVRSRMVGTPIDARPVAERFYNEMRDLRIDFDRSETPPKLDFSDSLISEDKSAQRVVEKTLRLLRRLPRDGGITADRAHDLKRQLDSLIDFQKQSKRGLTESGREFAKSVRREINESLRNIPGVGEEYGVVNDIMSRGIQTLDDMNDSMGSVINIFKSGMDAAVGRKLRGTLSNMDRSELMKKAIIEIDEVAAEFGGRFKDDVSDLVQFANTLEERFGNTRRQGFISGIEKGTQQALRGEFREMFTEKAAEVLSRPFTKSEDDAYRALERLIRRDFTPESQSTEVSTIVRSK